jgi:hypothetical protein
VALPPESVIDKDAKQSARRSTSLPNTALDRPEEDLSGRITGGAPPVRFRTGPSRHDDAHTSSSHQSFNRVTPVVPGAILTSGAIGKSARLADVTLACSQPPGGTYWRGSKRLLKKQSCGEVGAKVVSPMSDHAADRGGVSGGALRW